MQLAPDARGPVQVSATMEKLALSLTAEVSALVALPPGLVTVKTWVALIMPMTTAPKSWVGGVIVRVPGGTPVPDSGATAVPPGSPVTLRVAVLVPGIIGLKRALMAQLPLIGASTIPVHPSMVMVKCAVSVPVNPTASAPVLTPAGLATVKVTSGLLMSRTTEPKFWLAGVMVSEPDCSPMPVREACTVPPGVPWMDSVPVARAAAPGANATSMVQPAAAARV